LHENELPREQKFDIGGVIRVEVTKIDGCRVTLTATSDRLEGPRRPLFADLAQHFLEEGGNLIFLTNLG